MRIEYKNYIFDIIVASVALALGVIMLPVFPMSYYCIDLLLAIALIAYLVFYLFEELRQSRGTMFILTIIEFVAVAAIAIGLIFRNFNVIEIVANVSQTLGIVLWLRGINVAISLYLASLAAKRPKRDIAGFIIALLMITVGALIFATGIISDVIMEWVLCVALFIVALAFGFLAFLFSPIKKKKKK